MSAKYKTRPSSSITRIFNCLICTDSRGAGLEQTINRLPGVNEGLRSVNAEVRVEVIVRRGAKIQKLHEIIDNHPRLPSLDFIIVAGGICNLTDRVTTPGCKKLTYTDRSKVSDLKEAITGLFRTYGQAIHVATIPAAGLAKYFECNNGLPPSNLEELKLQQENLQEDVDTANQLIVDNNKERDLPTIPWAKQCTQTSKKRDHRTRKLRTVKKFCDKHLPDGVHPDDTLKEIWFKLVKDHIIKVVKKSQETEAALLDSTQSTESSDQETYNFKRKRKERTPGQPEQPRSAQSSFEEGQSSYQDGDHSQSDQEKWQHVGAKRRRQSKL